MRIAGEDPGGDHPLDTGQRRPAVPEPIWRTQSGRERTIRCGPYADAGSRGKGRCPCPDADPGQDGPAAHLSCILLLDRRALSLVRCGRHGVGPSTAGMVIVVDQLDAPAPRGAGDGPRHDHTRGADIGGVRADWDNGFRRGAGRRVGDDMTSDRPVAPLLTVKQVIPRVRDGAVCRDRLNERLTSATSRLTLVVAPAGWGKTVLLSSWATSLGPDAKVAWLSFSTRTTMSQCASGVI